MKQIERAVAKADRASEKAAAREAKAEKATDKAAAREANSSDPTQDIESCTLGVVGSFQGFSNSVGFQGSIFKFGQIPGTNFLSTFC